MLLILLLIPPIIFAQKDSLQLRQVNKNLENLNNLRDQLDDLFNDSNFSNATWGVYVRSLKTGEVIYKRNSDKLFYPASSMKLFTGAAALLLLGSNYTYETVLYANGNIRNGVLEGDLIIRGSGDPTISNRFYDGDPTVVFEAWADSLKAKGINKIRGSIIGDDSQFDEVRLGKGWAWDNESEWFSAPSGALSFNDNSIEIKITPGNEGFSPEIKISPETNYVTLAAKVVTVGANVHASVDFHRNVGTNLITIVGSIRKGNPSLVRHLSIEDPTMFFLTVLKETLVRKGIQVGDNLVSINSIEKTIYPEDLTPVLVHRSVPMNQILLELNKNSNNFYAEQILKTIGSEILNYGTSENGIQACRDLLDQMGINPDNLVIADGSGLSRLNLATPRQMVNLLSYLYKTDDFDTFYNSLPIAGVDGTLAARMKKTAAEKNVRAKAGYNTGASALSGYLKTVSGEPVAFSIIVNNYLVPTSLAYYIQDNVCQRLINFSRN